MLVARLRARWPTPGEFRVVFGQRLADFLAPFIGEIGSGVFLISVPADSDAETAPGRSDDAADGPPFGVRIVLEDPIPRDARGRPDVGLDTGHRPTDRSRQSVRVNWLAVAHHPMMP